MRGNLSATLPCLLYRDDVRARESLRRTQQSNNRIPNPAPAMETIDVQSDATSSYYAQVRSDVLGMLPSGVKRVLDVGCGSGATGAEARKRFGLDEIIGIEYDPDVAELARRHLDQVFVGDIESIDLPFPAGYFDAIICADVLEHTRDPWSVLRRLRPLLSDSGSLVISIPNIRHLSVMLKIFFDRFEYEPHGILDRGHLRFFTRHTVLDMLDSTGFVVDRMEANVSRGWKWTLISICSLGLLHSTNIVQHRIVAHKRRERRPMPDVHLSTTKT